MVRDDEAPLRVVASSGHQGPARWWVRRGQAEVETGEAASICEALRAARSAAERLRRRGAS